MKEPGAVQRPFAAGVAVNLGLLTAMVDVVPVRRPGTEKRTSLSFVCPTHDTKPTQMYFCQDCDKSYLPSELAKARETEEGLHRLTSTEVESIKESDMPTGTLTLSVCPAADMEAATRPSEQSYRLRLAKKAQSGAYSLLRALACDPEVALYGVCRLNARVAPTPFRVHVWRDQLVLQSLIRPADVAESEEIPDEVDEPLAEMGRELLNRLCKPFDADLLTDDRVAKLAALVDSVPVESKPASESSLMEMLAASLAAA